jgi:chemotaxis protein MotA
MKFGTLIGIILAIAGIAMGATMEGTNVAVVINVPAICVVLVGSLGVTIAACGLPAAIKIPILYKKAMMPDEYDLVGRVNELVGYAEQARRDGLLALDEAVKSIEDPFTKKGLQLVVDGTDPDLVGEILDAENEAMRKRHKEGAEPFAQAGAFAPCLAIVGTVFGLVNVMNNLSNPGSLGPLIAAAFLATLMGVGAANVVFLPVASRLKAMSAAEVELRTLTLEGILSVQAGDNPRIVAEKLESYMAPETRGGEEAARSAVTDPTAGTGTEAEAEQEPEPAMEAA